MNLTDKEILELNELCSAVVDETLTERQRVRLSDWLAASEEARRYYVRAMALSASLYTCASEMQVEEPDAVVSPLRILQFPIWRWAFGSLAAAAAVGVGLWISNGLKRDASPASPELGKCVAPLTGAKDIQWVKTATPMRPGDSVRQGQRLALASGFAEITFDSGARVVLEGPATLSVNSAWDETLLNGTLKASTPPEAIGFRISSPAVEVIDLGTEFTIIADASGAADVLVLKGEVEAARRDATGLRTLLLRENEARRFAPSGVSACVTASKNLSVSINRCRWTPLRRPRGMCVGLSTKPRPGVSGGRVWFAISSV